MAKKDRKKRASGYVVPHTMNCTLEQITHAITQCQAGNHFDENFRTIFDCHYPRLLRFFKSNCKLSEADSEDLTQEVFLRVYRHIGSFRDESAFTTWLWAIARNRFRSYLRKQRATRQGANAKTVSPESFNEEHEQLALDIADLSSESNPEQMTRDDEFTKIYREALNSLPGQMRHCMLHRLQGHTYQEIADLLGLNRGTVSKHLHDARKKIKTYLKHRDGGSPPENH